MLLFVRRNALRLLHDYALHGLLTVMADSVYTKFGIPRSSRVTVKSGRDYYSLCLSAASSKSSTSLSWASRMYWRNGSIAVSPGISTAISPIIWLYSDLHPRRAKSARTCPCSSTSKSINLKVEFLDGLTTRLNRNSPSTSVASTSSSALTPGAKNGILSTRKFPLLNGIAHKPS